METWVRMGVTPSLRPWCQLGERGLQLGFPACWVLSSNPCCSQAHSDSGNGCVGIGEHFINSAIEWRKAHSAIFLICMTITRQTVITNFEVTLIGLMITEIYIIQNTTFNNFQKNLSTGKYYRIKLNVCILVKKVCFQQVMHTFY
jgi:hypothetical protein